MVGALETCLEFRDIREKRNNKIINKKKKKEKKALKHLMKRYAWDDPTVEAQ